MHIQFLYFEDCPSHEQALARLIEVMSEEKVDAGIDIIRIETDDEAEQWHFTGSPTILINGRDIDPTGEDSTPALTCRVYIWDDGRYSPLPSHDMIRNALKTSA